MASIEHPQFERPRFFTPAINPFDGIGRETPRRKAQASRLDEELGKWSIDSDCVHCVGKASGETRRCVGESADLVRDFFLVAIRLSLRAVPSSASKERRSFPKREKSFFWNWASRSTFPLQIQFATACRQTMLDCMEQRRVCCEQVASTSRIPLVLRCSSSAF